MECKKKCCGSKNDLFLPKSNSSNNLFIREKQTQEQQQNETKINEQLAQVRSIQRALKSQPTGCACCEIKSKNHTHDNISNRGNRDVEANIKTVDFNSTDQEHEDTWIKLGQLGEFITAFGGVLVIGPLLDLALQVILRHSYKDYEQNNIANVLLKPMAQLECSIAMLLVAAILVIPAMIGAPHCHAQLEISSRFIEALNNQVERTILLLEQELTETFSRPTIDSQTIALPNKTSKIIAEFNTIEAKDIPKLNNTQLWYLSGDLQQHYLEYVGLMVLVILTHIKPIEIEIPLVFLALAFAGVACLPEWTTCKTTLRVMNGYNEGKIVKNPITNNPANWKTIASAITKAPAVFLANFLSFQQMCFGNLPAGLGLATCMTAGNIITQYVLNKNTQSLGQVNNTNNSSSEDKKTDWEKLNLLGKTLIFFRAFGTGNERSEPITLIILAACELSNKPLPTYAQATLAFGLFAAGTATAWSESRNIAYHLTQSTWFFKTAPYNDYTEIAHPLLADHGHDDKERGCNY